MARNKVSKRQLSFWYIPVALGVFFVVLWFILQQTSSNNLTALIPRQLTYNKWQCPIPCGCATVDPKTKEQIILARPMQRGAIEICTNKRLNELDYHPSNPFNSDIIDLFDQYREGFRDNNCQDICAAAYPGINPLYSTPWYTEFNSNLCERNGLCLLDPPSITAQAFPAR